MNWPEVVILLVTFKRTDYAIRTIRALKERLDYPNLWWHIADDGSGGEHQQALVSAIDTPGQISLTDTAQADGTGYNRNVGLRAAFERTPYVLHIEDDWELSEPYTLFPAMKVLTENLGVGMIRFGFLDAGHRGTTVAYSGRVWWELQKANNNFVFAGHPHLLHRRFHDSYGFYPQGLLPGATEETFARNVMRRIGPRILFPIYHNWGLFNHIGATKAEAFL